MGSTGKAGTDFPFSWILP